MTSNDLVERYVRSVAGNLPKGERDDVARELRSLIDDMLAERADAPGQAADEANTVAVLRELGQPEAVAERYGQPRPHLVGPTYYPVFKTVTTIVVAVLGILYLVATVWSLALSHRPPDQLLAGLWRSLVQFGTSILANVGLIALIFAAIERAAPAGSALETDWDPRKLPPITDPDTLELTGQAFELGFGVAAMAVFNLVVQTGIPVLVLGPEEARRLSIGFTPAFLAWVPWINLTFVLGIALNAFLLWRGRWQTITRLADIAIDIVTLYVLVRVLTLSQIAVTEWMDILCRLGIGVILVIVAVDMVQQVVRTVRHPRGSPTTGYPVGA